MRPCFMLELTSFSIILLTTSVHGLFFHYPKNALIDFFQSFHQKKEAKKMPQDIHHYHMHYYPTYVHDLDKPIKAPVQFDLDKLHSNQLESLGWGDDEFKHVPEPEIYETSHQDSWPAKSHIRSSLWDAELPNKPQHTVVEPEMPKAGLIVQVPIQQKIVVQNPPPDEKTSTNSLISFLQGIIRIKNSLFRPSEAKNKADPSFGSPEERIRGYFMYLQPEFGRKI
ncbi:uncharacterized protein [Venturia canescens]|uniref:uncharacterized protein isoform X2 n=1 Tax=Venturia canescens TaxID=32260 RepID=UPI001C9CD3C6|nr:uncharacterized protein LOC122407608 isoform X2 [Venturia canescens]